MVVATNMRYGTTQTTDILHVTGGLRGQRAIGGWLIGPLFKDGSLAAIGPVKDENFAETCRALGESVFGADDISMSDPLLPARVWRPLVGPLLLKHGHRPEPEITKVESATAPPATSPCAASSRCAARAGRAGSAPPKASFAAPDSSAPTRQGIKSASAPAEKSGERARRRESRSHPSDRPPCPNSGWRFRRHAGQPSTITARSPGCGSGAGCAERRTAGLRRDLEPGFLRACQSFDANLILECIVRPPTASATETLQCLRR